MTVPDMLDVSTPTAVHVIGAGGAGMGAIASVLVAMGHKVTGSDLRDSPVVTRLRAEGVAVAIGHDAQNIGSARVVLASSAIGRNNPEVQAAHDVGVPVMRRRDILPLIAASRSTIAVAGTHGKTTISSMLAMVLVEAGLDPSFIIGGDVNEVGTGASWGKGKWFIVEADESDRTFLALKPEIAVVANVEPDHLEAYENSIPELEAAFARFLSSGDTAIVCADDETAACLGKEVQAVSYGTSPDADYQMTDVSLTMPVSGFDFGFAGEKLGRIELPLPGWHNAYNAAAATVAALLAGASFNAAVDALKRFGGVSRRFEFRGNFAGITFIDDYAHLPTEVEAALDAAHTGDWQRIICVFQPHRYSRTATVGHTFANSFRAADHLVITEIYPAGEKPRPGVTSKVILDAVLDANPWCEVAWMRKLEEAADWLEKRLQPGDLCLTLNAGDLTALADMVIERLKFDKR